MRSLLVTALNLDVGRRMWWRASWRSSLTPAPSELSKERAAATGPG